MFLRALGLWLLVVAAAAVPQPAQASFSIPLTTLYVPVSPITGNEWPTLASFQESRTAACAYSFQVVNNPVYQGLSFEMQGNFCAIYFRGYPDPWRYQAREYVTQASCPAHSSKVSETLCECDAGYVQQGNSCVSRTTIKLSGGSSTRALIAGGDLRTAHRLLGRPYTLSGRVVRGDGRGHTIGIPTINVGDYPDRKLLPPDGVYAARVEWAGGAAGGMLNQGPKPTFGETRRSVEVHLFGVNADLYGQWVRVEWVERLRDVTRFGSVGELTQQLERDRVAAQDALARQESLMDLTRATRA